MQDTDFSHKMERSQMKANNFRTNFQIEWRPFREKIKSQKNVIH